MKLTRTLPRYKNADVLILSIGKSGRTWLRVLINKYFSLKNNIPFELNDLHRIDDSIPSIIYTHEMWRHYTHARLPEFLKGKYIIPDNILYKKKVILLYRDPRDVVVSLYFQATNRSKRYKGKVPNEISDFIRHKTLGIYNIVKVMNKWHSRLSDHQDILRISYEDMKKDVFMELKKILEFIGIENVDNESAREAVNFSDFNNMKLMEAKGAFNKQALSPVDRNDTNSYKVREGKTGGYVRHFNDSDLDYLNEAMEMLNDIYGYKGKHDVTAE